MTISSIPDYTLSSGDLSISDHTSSGNITTITLPNTADPGQLTIINDDQEYTWTTNNPHIGLGDSSPNGLIYPQYNIVLDLDIKKTIKILKTLPEETLICLLPYLYKLKQTITELMIEKI